MNFAKKNEEYLQLVLDLEEREKILTNKKEEFSAHLNNTGNQKKRLDAEYQSRSQESEESNRKKESEIKAFYSKEKEKAKKEYDEQLSQISLDEKEAKNARKRHNNEVAQQIKEKREQQKKCDDSVTNELNKLKKQMEDLLQPSADHRFSCLDNSNLLNSVREYYMVTQELSNMENSHNNSKDSSSLMKFDEKKAENYKVYQQRLKDLDIDCQARIVSEKKRYEQEKQRIDKWYAAEAKRITEEWDALAKKQALMQKQLIELEKNNESVLLQFLEEAEIEIAEHINLAEQYKLRGDNVCNEDNLPISITIGKAIERIENYELLQVLYRESNSEFGAPITLNLKDGRGNIIINNANNLAADKYLDNVIAGLILKYLEEFPIGSLKVGIIDQNSVYCLNALNGSLSNTNKTNKSIVHDEVLKDYGDVIKYLNSFGNRAYPFEVYDAYTSNPMDTQMHLVVIRSGFANLCANNAHNLLNLIRPLATNPQCGIRFIIVNDMADLDRNRFSATAIDTMLPEILNTAVVLDYESKAFTYNGCPAVLTTVCDVDSDPTRFVVTECNKLMKKLDQLFSESSIVPYEKIGFGELYHPDKNDGDTDYSIHIPVGVVNGRTRFSLEFSCSGSGTPLAHYTVLGSHRRGKSSLFHSMVLNGSRKYSPEELEFWLFDFKDCDTSDTYQNGKVPHIRFLQETMLKDNDELSSEDQINLAVDLNSLLNLVKKERSRRASLIQKLRSQFGVTIRNIGDYNQYIKNYSPNGYGPMPRIIVALDEPNQIYNFNGNMDYGDLKKSIESSYSHLLTQTGAYGIHFVSFVHTIMAGNYANSYVNNTQGRITFGLDHIDQQEMRTLGEQFLHVQDQIGKLNSGECYVMLSKGAIPQKVKICYASDLNGYLERIAEHYRDFKSNVLIVGKNEPLGSDAEVQISKKDTQVDYMKMLTAQQMRLNNGVSDELDFYFLLGEDRYSLKPVCVNFGQTKVGRFVICGKKTKLRESVLAGMLLQCAARKFEYHVAYLSAATRNIFTELLDYLGKDFGSEEHNNAELTATYKALRERKKAARNKNYSSALNPIFLFVDEPTKAFHEKPQPGGNSSASVSKSENEYQKIELFTHVSDDVLEARIKAEYQGRVSPDHSLEVQQKINAARSQGQGKKPPFGDPVSTESLRRERNDNDENGKQMDASKSNYYTSKELPSSAQMLAELEKDGSQYGIFLIISKQTLSACDIDDSDSLVTLVTNSMDCSELYSATDLKQSIASLHNNNSHAVYINTKDEFTKIRPVVFENKEKIASATKIMDI